MPHLIPHMPTTRPLPTRLALRTAALVASLVLAACGGGGGAATNPTQAAAKVGGEEITVHQVNQLLQGAPAIEGQDAQAMGRAVLEKLIDQQLALNQANEAKLHRAPDVVAQIEAARREILARAYLQQLSANVTKPTAAEVEAYYRANPALFSDRRVYNVQEVLVPLGSAAKADATLLPELQRLVKGPNPVANVVQLLQARQLPHNQGSATRSAEDLPLTVLPQLHALADGQATVLQAPQNLTVVQVLSSQRVPMAKEQALPRIELFLYNQRVGEQVAARLKELRSTTPIEYLGTFAGGPTPVAAPVDLDKGVAGLKR